MPLVTLPPLARTTPSVLVPAMWPLFVTVPAAPVTKTPNPPPLTDPVELFVSVPPSARSMPAPLVPLALTRPLFVTVPAALDLT